MIVQCPNCSTKYNLPEDKIPDAGIKVQCSKCGHQFKAEKPKPEPVAPVVEPVIEAEQAAAPEPPAEQPEQQPSEPEDEIEAMLDGNAPAPEEDPGDAFDAALEDMADAEEPVAEEEPPAAEPAGADAAIPDDLPDGMDDLFDDVEEPAADEAPPADPGEDAPEELATEEDAVADAVDAVAEQEADGTLFDDKEPEDTADDLFAEMTAEADAEPEPAPATGEEASDLFPDTGGSFGEESEAASESDLEDDLFSDDDAGDAEDLFADDAGADDADDLFADEDDDASAEEDLFDALSAGEEDEAEEITDLGLDDLGDGKKKKKKKKKDTGEGGSKKKIGCLVAIVVLIGLAVGIFFLKPWAMLGIDPAAIPVVGPMLMGDDEAAEPGKTAAERVREISLVNVKQYYEVNRNEGNIFVVEGEAMNKASTPKDRIKVNVTLYGQASEVLATQDMLCGNTLTVFQLRELSRSEIEKILNSEVGVLSNNTFLRTGAKTKFMVVFFDPPAGVKEFLVKTVDAQDPE